ncbi:class I SAM-dependent methyltransferase [bacterium]|nr:class I SAM-dependent methyltransferase [bacterium]
MKYYYPEHIIGYQRIKAEGKTAWNEIHGSIGFENFSSREFLAFVLPKLQFSTPNPAVLEYGCGTGPGACFLAERGFQVDGIDIIPTAIEMAKQIAKEQNLDIHYEVQDICELSHEGKKYDMIVDSYCLQGIVTDADREKVFSAVHARLKPEGYYLISTAIFDEERFGEEVRIDKETGWIYNKYGDSIIDTRTSIVYIQLDEEPSDYEEAIKIGNVWYLPNRRHLKPPDLKEEIEAVGFKVLYQDGGNVICVYGGGVKNRKVYPVGKRTQDG